MHRRRETLGVLTFIACLPICLTVFFFLLTTPLTKAFAVAYLIWVFFWDDAPSTGGRRWQWVRKWECWKMMRDFYPVELHKEADLDPTRNYIFGYHPHGVISMGAWVNFATEANSFSTLFPGIHLRLLTLKDNFKVPIFRDLILFLSIASVSRRSCESILRKGDGHSLMIVVGGAQESLFAFPGTYDLVLKKRLGFIKLAMRNGASLVPVMSFGENDVYDQIDNPQGSLVRSFQNKLKNTFGWTLPLINGRGIFNYTFGIVPHRRRIVSVVGRPIHLDKFENEDITDEKVKEIWQQYADELMRVFDVHKDKYAPDRVSDLRFVE
ncbi:diacylglycerol O-acyltransferase 2 [Paraphysoderma sedebokerense]|nr:diacylglycerol O-acyltransferase 2 [Paraphysoderma sedebokerense]